MVVGRLGFGLASGLSEDPVWGARSTTLDRAFATSTSMRQSLHLPLAALTVTNSRVPRADCAGLAAILSETYVMTYLYVGESVLL